MREAAAEWSAYVDARNAIETAKAAFANEKPAQSEAESGTERAVAPSPATSLRQGYGRQARN